MLTGITTAEQILELPVEAVVAALAVAVAVVAEIKCRLEMLLPRFPFKNFILLSMLIRFFFTGLFFSVK